jgi:CMP-2-keto-3-deoxyoctulosonic acid synthetase
MSHNPRLTRADRPHNDEAVAVIQGDESLVQPRGLQLCAASSKHYSSSNARLCAASSKHYSSSNARKSPLICEKLKRIGLARTNHTVSALVDARCGQGHV